jgi:type II secretory pathway pseudopilin PulG
VRRLRRGEGGYTLLVLIGLLTVFAIVVAAALPRWVAYTQREKEAELVARGLQYAEAIRVFRERNGRLPNTLAELVEIEPRSIRQLWKDPFTGAADWLLVMETPGGNGALMTIDPATGQIVGAPGAGTQKGDASDTEENENGDEPAGNATAPTPGGLPASPFGAQGAPISGPIHGVKSRSHGDSYRTYFDRKEIGDWDFTVERLVAATQATTSDGLLRRADYSTIGRAFRYPPPGGVPGANPQQLASPGQKPGRPQQPGQPPPGQGLPRQPPQGVPQNPPQNDPSGTG